MGPVEGRTSTTALDPHLDLAVQVQASVVQSPTVLLDVKPNSGHVHLELET